MICLNCKKEMTLNEIEVLGHDEMDFMKKNKSNDFGINMNIGNFSIKNNSLLHTKVQNIYNCDDCNRILVEFKEV
jgi:DNA-directed RNA polymerase subunit RPC12/RpoP